MPAGRTRRGAAHKAAIRAESPQRNYWMAAPDHPGLNCSIPGNMARINSENMPYLLGLEKQSQVDDWMKCPEFHPIYQLYFRERVKMIKALIANGIPGKRSPTLSEVQEKIKTDFVSPSGECPTVPESMNGWDEVDHAALCLSRLRVLSIERRGLFWVTAMTITAIDEGLWMVMRKADLVMKKGKVRPTKGKWYEGIREESGESC